MTINQGANMGSFEAFAAFCAEAFIRDAEILAALDALDGTVQSLSKRVGE